MSDFLSGIKVLLTGAGPKIGRGIALEMAAAGAEIYFIERNEERRAALTRELSERGFSSHSFLCDVSQPDAIDEVLAQLEEQKTTIDVLVNNVGVGQQQLAEITPQFARWQRLMDTNVLGPLYLSHGIAQKMIENGKQGNILFISSIHQTQFHGDELYSASKAALGMIINELAVSLSPHGIRVNGIAPGYCDESADGTPLPSRETALGHQSVGPRHIGRAALFLASDYFSAHTTGTTLWVDGGLSLYSARSQNIIAPPPTPSLVRRLARRGKRELKELRDHLR